jgi:hypothetical protein
MPVRITQGMRAYQKNFLELQLREGLTLGTLRNFANSYRKPLSRWQEATELGVEKSQSSSSARLR